MNSFEMNAAPLNGYYYYPVVISGALYQVQTLQGDLSEATCVLSGTFACVQLLRGRLGGSVSSRRMLARDVQLQEVV